MNNNQVNQASQTTAFQSVRDEKDQLTDKISLATEYLRQLDYLISEAYKLVNKQPSLYPVISHQAHRLLKQMAVVACAGELASKITGWERGKAITAVKACFDDWLERNGNHASLETRQIIAQVTHFLQTQETRFADWSYGQDKRHNQAGFYDGEVYRIYTGVFKDEVCKDFDPLQVARVLKDNGLLKCNKDYRLQVVSRAHGIKGGYFYAIKTDIFSFEC